MFSCLDQILLKSKIVSRYLKVDPFCSATLQGVEIWYWTARKWHIRSIDGLISRFACGRSIPDKCLRVFTPPPEDDRCMDCVVAAIERKLAR